MNGEYIFAPKQNLSSLNVWISGSVPEREHWTHPLVDRDILEFVSFFSAIVFQKNGTIIHGCHPVFTPILAKQAERFSKNKKQLQLYVSALWGDAEFKKYSDSSVISVVASHKNSTDLNDPEVRNKSLTQLRKKLALRSNCVISIGGKKHLTSGFRAGVSEELEIAQKYGLPCYNIASFGGEASTVDVNSSNPFLTVEEEKLFESLDGISFLISSLISALERDRNRIQLRNFTQSILRILKNKH